MYCAMIKLGSAGNKHMRKRGNPEFGNKYKANLKAEKPLTAQVKVMMLPETQDLLKELANKKDCTVPDLVRAAIDNYLASASIDEAV